MAADVELLGLYWTVSGPVEVHVGREWSLFSWADRCAEARKVGFSGLGIWHADLQHVLETRSLLEMKQAFDDNGLRYLELEFIMDWFLDEDDDRRKESDTIRELLFSAAAELGAHHIKVGNIPGTPAELSRLFVVPGARRRGVAEALVTVAAEWAREKRLPLVLEVVDEGRSSAIAFYESHGWELTHTSVADWTGPGGSPVRLRHYRLASR